MGQTLSMQSAIDPRSPYASDVPKLRNSLQNVNWSSTDLIRRFYVCMMEKGDDNIRRLFAHTDIDRQATMLRAFLNTIVGGQYDEESWRRVATLHAHLGVRVSDFKVFQEAFITTLKEASGPYFQPEWEEAWGRVFDIVARFHAPLLADMRTRIERLAVDDGSVNEVEADVLTREESGYIRGKVSSPLGAKPSTFTLEVRASKSSVAIIARSHTPGAEMRLRFLELRGHLLYFLLMLNLKTTTDTIKRVVDISRAVSVEERVLTPEEAAPARLMLSEGPHALFFVVTIRMKEGAAVEFTVCGETEKETWVVALRRSISQFSSAEPAPTIQDVDVDAVILNKLKFVPEDFTVLTLLGRGSFGRVLKVQHTATGKIYAMKVINKTRFSSLKNIVEIRRERAILDQVSNPFIVGYHGMFQTATKLFFLFDFLSGGELFYHTQKAPDHHFDEPTCRFYLAEMALALEHLRERHIIHRDIKGNNFVLDSEGHVILTDFGFAKHNCDKRRNKSTCGTLAYIAPEVISATERGYSHEVDWWGLGVVLFTMLTGFFPFLRQKSADTARAIARDPLRFPTTPAVSEEAKSVCIGLLRKKPDERIASLAQLAAEPWFKGWDWEGTARKRITPPFVPDKSGSNTRYFSPSFTTDVAAVTIADESDEAALTREGNVFGSYFAVREERGSESEDEDSF